MLPITTQIKRILTEQEGAVEAWFDGQFSGLCMPFYSSVDIRHSGAKMVPVDNNLFPAGFNLLSENAVARASQAVKSYVQDFAKEAKNIVLIPENHTRNQAYLSNVVALRKILQGAGMNVQIANPNVAEAQELMLDGGDILRVEPLQRRGNLLHVGDFVADFLLVNNDLSAGAPEMLRGLEQPVFPPVGMGWYRRRKTEHFESYARVAAEFAAEFSVDPWLISALFGRVDGVAFKEKSGLVELARVVDELLVKIQGKYDEYGVDDAPYVFIKANNGTYGMGVMTAKSGADVLEMNKNARKKMHSIKDGERITEVIVQEGVPTIEAVDGRPSESLLYLVGGRPVGCLYRIHEGRDKYGSLNRSGMEFSNNDELDATRLAEQKNCPVKGLIARLSTLAAAYEIEELAGECGNEAVSAG